MALVRLLCSWGGVPLSVGNHSPCFKGQVRVREIPYSVIQSRVLYQCLQASQRCSRYWLGSTW